MHVMGIDIGTQGARVIVCGADGKIIAQASESFARLDEAALPPGWAEQNPVDWWIATETCIKKVIDLLHDSRIGQESIAAISVDSTSGTVVPIDASGNPLRPAMMYNDSRAEAEASECNMKGSALTDKLGYKFASSFALPKILWLKNNEPELFRKTSLFIHAADYIVGKLSGDFNISDTSNALKTGYDLVDRCWPGFIENELGITINRLPSIVNPGARIGSVTLDCMVKTGLAAGTPIIAGVTDGTAGFLASGAVKPGDWNSTIGTTLVLRGVSTELVKDTQGRIYCHAHPQGYWLPGGASNVGAECITRFFNGQNLDELNARVHEYTPSPMLVYPLARIGERLPFINPDAERFVIGSPSDNNELYTAYLQGVGFVERWCYELMQELGAEVGDTVFTTGGGAKSSAWMQVRADIMGRCVVRPESPECVMGTAAVAASGSIYKNLESAVSAMIKTGESAEPNGDLVDKYDGFYHAFRQACAERGYE